MPIRQLRCRHQCRMRLKRLAKMFTEVIIEVIKGLLIFLAGKLLRRGVGVNTLPLWIGVAALLHAWLGVFLLIFVLTPYLAAFFVREVWGHETPDPG